MVRTCQSLTLDEIVEINHCLVLQFGGAFFSGDRNLANSGSLEHVLVEIQSSLYGQDLYPTVLEKCALVGYRIIDGHVFHDGNKRTGIEVCRLMLELNGYWLAIDREAVDIALQVGKGELDFAGFLQWISRRTTYGGSMPEE
jgi:death on curing protein